MFPMETSGHHIAYICNAYTNNNFVQVPLYVSHVLRICQVYKIFDKKKNNNNSYKIANKKKKEKMKKN